MSNNSTPQNKERSFTALYDDYPQELQGSLAWVYAVINRHCMMRHDVCSASQKTLAKECRLSVSTVKRQVNELIRLGYVRDIYPDRKRHVRVLVTKDRMGNYIDLFP